MAAGNLSCPRVVRAFVIHPFPGSRARKTGHHLHSPVRCAEDSRSGWYRRPKPASGAIRGEGSVGCRGHAQGERNGSTAALKIKAGLAWMGGAGDRAHLHTVDRS
jgi:hypothetical protein